MALHLLLAIPILRAESCSSTDNYNEFLTASIHCREEGEALLSKDTYDYSILGEPLEKVKAPQSKKRQHITRNPGMEVGTDLAARVSTLKTSYG